MSCASCGSNGGTPRGCKNNGTCGSHGCNKLTVYNWLENMQLPQGQAPFRIAEVRFKNSRKAFFHYPENWTPQVGEAVVTETPSNTGYDVGRISLVGELVRFQLRKKKLLPESENILQLLRKATDKDIATWQAARDREQQVQKRSREMALALKLNMKLSDVEFQGDGKKATFYYTADHRVDFRQLIKDMSQAFKIRIEMRQIGLREEASRLGAVGSCGRELCCSTWLTDFRTVATSAARYQQLSLNPTKLAGQCGKLKCCLNFELDAYRDALKAFPRMETQLLTEKGTAVCQKMDIFKGMLWYTYKGDWMQWYALTVESATTIIAKNKAQEPVSSLEDYSLTAEENTRLPHFENAVGQDSLNRFDRPKKSKPQYRKRNNTRNAKRKNA